MTTESIKTDYEDANNAATVLLNIFQGLFFIGLTRCEGFENLRIAREFAHWPNMPTVVAVRDCSTEMLFCTAATDPECQYPADKVLTIRAQNPSGITASNTERSFCQRCLDRLGVNVTGIPVKFLPASDPKDPAPLCEFVDQGYRMKATITECFDLDGRYRLRFSDMESGQIISESFTDDLPVAVIKAKITW